MSKKLLLASAVFAVGAFVVSCGGGEPPPEPVSEEPTPPPPSPPETVAKVLVEVRPVYVPPVPPTPGGPGPEQAIVISDTVGKAHYLIEVKEDGSYTASQVNVEAGYENRTFYAVHTFGNGNMLLVSDSCELFLYDKASNSINAIKDELGTPVSVSDSNTLDGSACNDIVKEEGFLLTAQSKYAIVSPDANTVAFVSWNSTVANVYLGTPSASTDPKFNKVLLSYPEFAILEETTTPAIKVIKADDHLTETSIDWFANAGYAGEETIIAKKGGNFAIIDMSGNVIVPKDSSDIPLAISATSPDAIALPQTKVPVYANTLVGTTRYIAFADDTDSDNNPDTMRYLKVEGGVYTLFDLNFTAAGRPDYTPYLGVPPSANATAEEGVIDFALDALGHLIVAYAADNASDTVIAAEYALIDFVPSDVDNNGTGIVARYETTDTGGNLVVPETPLDYVGVEKFKARDRDSIIYRSAADILSEFPLTAGATMPPVQYGPEADASSAQGTVFLRRDDEFVYYDPDFSPDPDPGKSAYVKLANNAADVQVSLQDITPPSTGYITVGTDYAGTFYIKDVNDNLHRCGFSVADSTGNACERVGLKHDEDLACTDVAPGNSILIWSQQTIYRPSSTYPDFRHVTDANAPLKIGEKVDVNEWQLAFKHWDTGNVVTNISDRPLQVTGTLGPGICTELNTASQERLTSDPVHTTAYGFANSCPISDTDNAWRYLHVVPTAGDSVISIDLQSNENVCLYNVIGVVYDQ